jgi:hypothetical protein
VLHLFRRSTQQSITTSSRCKLSPPNIL